MILAGQLAHAWLATLAMMIAQGTLLALIALLITRAGKLAPAWQAAIWLVVIVKLAVPWGPALPWSLSDLIAGLSSSGGDAATAALPPALAPLPPAPSLAHALGWLVLAASWLGGAAYVLVRALRAERRAVRAARLAPAAPDHAQALLAVLAARAGVRAPRLVVGDAGPHVVRLVRPTIAIPHALLGDMALLRAALLHELAHVRRRDAFARLVQIWASALGWWWPVVRRVSRRLDATREAACDAWALEAGDVPRPAYARLLVQMAHLRHVRAGAALAAPHALDARIAAVLGPPARTRLGHVHRLALVAWVAVALGGARSAAAAHVTCHYTPQLAEQLFLAHPEADLDGDGVLSRDEACELQAELRRHAEQLSSPLDASDEALVSEPLCCNCDRAEAYSSPEAASCHQVEGVDR